MSGDGQRQGRRARRVSVAVPGIALGLALAVAGPAFGRASISGADADVWNVVRPVPTYEITSDTPGAIVAWRVNGGGWAAGQAPYTLRLTGLADGTHRLEARQLTGDDRGRAVRRSFRLDTTPPGVTVARPLSGEVVAQGAPLTAEYACTGAVTCEGPVASGASIDTSANGPVTFRVRAVDDAGNETVALVDYVVQSRPAPPAPAPTGQAAAPAAPILLTSPPAPSVTSRPAPLRPRTHNARALRPVPGARISTSRPLLRWTPHRGARLYNVQVFRVRGQRVTKVVSAFPRSNRYRVPAKRLAPGERYVWRVWPYVNRRYLGRPLGVSYFDVRRPPTGGGTAPR